MKLSPKDKRRRREIYRLLYRMQRRYGIEADLYKYQEVDTGDSFDVETGKPTSGESAREKISLKRFISWDATLNQKFEYDISFIKANSNFAYGGLFQVGDRIGIIGRNEGKISESFEMEQEFYLVLKGKRYNIHRWNELDPRAGWIVHMRSVNSQLLHQNLEGRVQHHISLEQTITATL